MITTEPQIRVGIIDAERSIQGVFRGPFTTGAQCVGPGEFWATVVNGTIRVQASGTTLAFQSDSVEFVPQGDATFMLNGVKFGIGFHWEMREDQIFGGSLRLVRRDDGSLVAINIVRLEEYLTSVISSEMSSANSLELLKAHATVSRSWLVAMLEREKSAVLPDEPHAEVGNESGPRSIIRWYSREDHDLYDVCADDHCQRYQGITRIESPVVREAVKATRGMLLLHNGQVCDARFSKSCGGIAEDFSYVWEGKKIPYLGTFSDSQEEFPEISSENDAERWIFSAPRAFCNVSDPLVVRQILPSFDLQTQNFFRWQVRYEREELEALIRTKGKVDLGTLLDLVPEKRGPSGRICLLRVVGSRGTISVGKELEIRKWLSPTHLYSSCFVVKREGVQSGIPRAFVLSGAGWGHGVGLCQIGAAAMALRGYSSNEILRHYYRGTEVSRLYDS